MPSASTATCLPRSEATGRIVPLLRRPAIRRMGRHHIVEFVDCDPEALRFVRTLKPLVLAATRDCGATIVDHSFHQFEPDGVSGTILIAESHVSFHSWPEHGYLSLDVFTCGDSMDARGLIRDVRAGVGAAEARVVELKRGF